METSITEVELAENLAQVIDRVRRGEQFVIFRDGEAVAVLGPSHPKLSTTVKEVAERLKNIASPEEGHRTAPEGTTP